MLSAILMLVSFSGCAPVWGGGCPVPLITYSAEFQKSAALELDLAKQTTPKIATLVVDYGKTRDAIRAVCGK